MESVTAANVTAIIAVLNGEETIERAIESVMSQRESGEPRVRVIIINGRSTDGTIERIRKYPDVQILDQKSQGLASARNEALENVETPLVAFCDSDDAWTPGSLGKKLERMRQSPLSWAVSGQVHFVEGGFLKSGLLTRRKLGTKHLGVTPGAMLIKRSAFEVVGRFDETLKIGADADWIVRAVQTLGPIDFLEMIVLDKGIHAGSLSTETETYRRELQLISRRFIDRLRDDIK